MGDNSFNIKLQAVLEKIKSIANIKADIKTIESKLPKIKLQGTLNKTAVKKELDTKLKTVKPKVKIDADTTQAEKKIKKIGKQKTDPTITPKVDNTQALSGLKQAQKETKTLWERFTSGIAGINLIQIGIQKVVQAIHQAVAGIKELDAVKTNIQMVSGASDSGVNAMLSSYNAMAKDLSSTTKDVAEAANEFLRMGESVASTNKLIKSSQVLSKVGMIESSDAASYLISSLKGYKIAAEDSLDVVSKLTSVDLEAAVSAGGLAEAISRCSNIANNSGTTMDRLIGYTATVGEVTQESMSVIGNAFKSVYSRMNNIKIGKFVDDETGESLSDTEAVLNKLGIRLRDTADTYRNFDDVLDDIGNNWKSFTQVEQNAISVAMAGTMQRERFTALMNNYSKALEYSEVAADSAGSALERYGVYQDSIQAKTNELTAAIESLSTNVISEELYSGIIEATTGVVEFIDKANLLKGTLAGLVTMGISKAFVSMATGIISATKSTAQLTAAMALFDNGRSKQNLLAIGAACKGLSDQQLKLVLSTKGLTDAQRQRILEGMGLEAQERQQTLSTLGFAAAEDKATLSTFSFKGALNSLKTVIGMNPIGAIATAVSAVTIAFSVYKQHQEEVRQATEEAANTYKESASSIDDYVSRYQELHKALLDAKGDEEETYNVKKQLLDLQTELNDKFGDEYGAINLVTEAYKDQTGAIKALNKETAQTFLNENKSGIDKAEKAMTKDRHYNLSLTGISAYTDEGAALKEAAEKYKEQGVTLLDELGDGNYSQFSIHLKADAQSAYETINAFENDLRDKAKELGDEHMFDDVLDIASGSLNQAGKTIEKYGDIFKQSLTAEIVSDDRLSRTYNEALEAVEDYNEAVLRSENIYDDENVAEAKGNLDAVRSSIEENKAEWGRYAVLVDDVFGQADTRLLEFNEAMKNNSELKNLADSLKGLSDLDLKAFDDTGDNASFEKLKESAEEYNVSVDELVDSLVRLGYVQGGIISGASDIEEPKWDFSGTITQLDELKDKFNVIDQTYAKLFDADTEIGFEDLSSINEAFKDLDGIDSFIQRLQEAGQDTEAVAAVMQDLIAAYLDYSGVLDNVTAENSALIEQFLTEMGIENAHEIVLAQLSGQTEALALQKQFLTEKGYELIDATLEETVQFLNEADASDEAKMSIAQLALAKLEANNTVIDTSADIENVIALANAAGASAAAIAKFKNAMAVIENAKTQPVNGVGGLKQLDYAQSLKDSVENSTYDWEFQKLDARDFKVGTAPKYTPKYSGGSSTKKAMDSTAKDAAKSAEKAAKEIENRFEETVDFFKRRGDVLNDALSLLKTNLDNVTGSFAKNKLIDAELGITEEKFRNYSDALNMYTQKANEALSKLPSDIAAKIKDGAVDLTTFIGDGNKDVVEAVKDYEQWADKVADCKQELAELRTAIRQLELEKFNNIMDDFQNQFDLHEDGKGLISKQIDLLKEAGQLIGESFFTAQIDQSKKQLELLEKEKAQLAEQMSSAIGSGRVQKGSDEWISMVDSLSQVEGNILDCKKAIEEFDNELLQLHWDVFDRIQGQFKDLDSELSNLRGLFEDAKVTDDNFNWSKEALAQLGLLAQQYELVQHQVQQYSDELNQLGKDYLNGRYSATEYADKLSELSSAQWEAVNASESIRDAIIDLNEVRIDEEIDAIEKEIDAYRELIDSQIEALKSAKDLHDYQERIAEKTKSITDLERQIAAMRNDDTAASIAKRKQLEEQLAQAKKELENEQYAHSIEEQENALNKEFENYENARNEEIEALKASLEEKEQLIAESFETVKQNADLIGQEIAAIATEHGVTVSNAIITSWQNGETAIASYGAVLSEQTSAFIGNLMGVEYEVYNLQAQANATADTLAWMFSTRADTLVGELASSYYSEQNLNYMTQALHDSLVRTLEGGYNISGITSALDSIAGGLNGVASAANNAASAMAAMGAAQANVNSGNSSRNEPFFSYTSLPDTVKRDSIKTYTPEYAYYVKDGILEKRKIKSKNSYASGTRNAKGGLRVVNEEGAELTLEKLQSGNYTIGNEGDQILTKEQTDNIFEWSQVLPDDFMERILKMAPTLLSWDIPNFSAAQQDLIPEIREQKSDINVHYDKLIEINGDVNDADRIVNKMETVAEKAIKKSWHDFEMTRKYGIY